MIPVYSLLLVVVSVVPFDVVPIDTVDVIELNHLFDNEGKNYLDQWIFWDLDQATSKYHVVAWLPARKRQQTYTKQNQLYIFHIDDHGHLRKLQASAFRCSFTQNFDPELNDRTDWPLEKRRGLKQ